MMVKTKAAVVLWMILTACTAVAPSDDPVQVEKPPAEVGEVAVPTPAVPTPTAVSSTSCTLTRPG